MCTAWANQISQRQGSIRNAITQRVWQQIGKALHYFEVAADLDQGWFGL